MFSMAVLVLALFAFGCSNLDAQQARAPDSLQAQLAALAALRRLEAEMSSIRGNVRGFTAARRGPFGVCELPIADFCYGYRNGALSFGGYGTTIANRRLAVSRYSLVDQRRLEREIESYTRALREAGRITPDDRWIMSELVRSDVERGNLLRAVESAGSCAVERWWCEALRAYVIHLAGAWSRADSIWSTVLHDMPAVERCAWLDPTGVSADKGFAQHYRAADCDARYELAERAWWLSDPFFSVDGNERRSEHMARLVDLILTEGAARRTRWMSLALQRRATEPLPSDSSMLALLNPQVQLGRPPWALSFPFGYSEVVVRLGPPYFLAPTDSADGRTIVQYPHPRTSFVPEGAALLNRFAATPDSWKVSDRYAFEFMTPWRGTLHQIDFQVAYFRRGDSALVLAATDLRASPALTARRNSTAIVLQRDFHEPVYRATGSGTEVVRFQLMAPRDSGIVSIEIVGAARDHGRARLAAGPQQITRTGLELSELMLVELGAEENPTIERAAQLALGRTAVGREAPVGIFWEVYGLNAGDMADVSLTASREGQPLLSGLLQGILRRGGVGELSTSWREGPAAGMDIEPRAIGLNLSTLQPGRYEFAVTVRVEGREPVVSRRTVQVLR
jgi:hypothetical protein